MKPQPGALEAELGVAFEDESLFQQALTHSSWAFEHEGSISNERLEFLGDAVLDLVVAELAFTSYPDRSEGWLSPLRASMVKAPVLADIARSLELGSHLLLGRGEERGGGRDKENILADALEALIGAIYLDRGLDAVSEVVRRLVLPRMEAYSRGEGDQDFKTLLQELATRRLRSVPDYQIEESGPAHEKQFSAQVYVKGHAFGEGEGRSKKEAEQQAAREALPKLEALADLSEEPSAAPVREG